MAYMSASLDRYRVFAPRVLLQTQAHSHAPRPLSSGTLKLLLHVFFKHKRIHVHPSRPLYSSTLNGLFHVFFKHKHIHVLPALSPPVLYTDWFRHPAPNLVRVRCPRHFWEIGPDFFCKRVPWTLANPLTNVFVFFPPNIFVSVFFPWNLCL